MKKIALILSLVMLFGFASVNVFADDTAGVTGATTGNTVAGAESATVVTCMQNAVEKRDTSIGTALDTYTTAAKAALSARTTALKAAWAITVKKDRKTALTTAWTTYKKAIQDARSAFKTGKKTAWDTFKTDSKACKPTKTQDNTNQSADNNL
jgi:hypothetical protein